MRANASIAIDRNKQKELARHRRKLWETDVFSAAGIAAGLPSPPAPSPIDMGEGE